MRLHRAIHSAFILLAASQAACFTWRYETAPVPEVVQQAPKRLWVPIGADSSLILIAPRIVDDSLTGLIEGSAPGGQRLARFAQPVSSITRVATERPNFGYAIRNLVAIAGVVATITLAGLILGPTQ